jgi:glycosyltransferase involved in cell wall biosynthesis
VNKKAVIILNRDLGKAGGVERSVISIVKVLNECGFKVQLLCLRKPKLNEIERLYGEKIKLEEVFVPKINFSCERLIGGLILLPLFIRITKDAELIVDIDGGFLYRFLPHKRLNYLIYQLSVPDPTYMGWVSGNFVIRILARFYNELSLRLFGPSCKYPIIAHSKFTEKQLWRVFRIKAVDVLYPPVSKKFFNYKIENRKNQIVCLARFSPEKKFEFALYILDRILRKRKDVILYLIGSTRSRFSNSYIRHLKEIIDKRGLKNYVVILTDISENRLIEILREAKIFLSFQTKPESFNISILEGMAAGCVPIVPKCKKGAWDEILAEGKYGFGFNTLTECVEIILHILNLNNHEFNRLSSTVVNRAQYFSEEKFKKRFIRIIKHIMNKKYSTI